VFRVEPSVNQLSSCRTSRTTITPLASAHGSTAALAERFWPSTNLETRTMSATHGPSRSPAGFLPTPRADAQAWLGGCEHDGLNLEHHFGATEPHPFPTEPWRSCGTVQDDASAHLPPARSGATSARIQAGPNLLQPQNRMQQAVPSSPCRACPPRVQQPLSHDSVSKWPFASSSALSLMRSSTLNCVNGLICGFRDWAWLAKARVDVNALTDSSHSAGCLYHGVGNLLSLNKISYACQWIRTRAVGQARDPSPLLCLA
jgi:hypothetical protein